MYRRCIVVFRQYFGERVTRKGKPLDLPVIPMVFDEPVVDEEINCIPLGSCLLLNELPQLGDLDHFVDGERPPALLRYAQAGGLVQSDRDEVLERRCERVIAIALMADVCIVLELIGSELPDDVFVNRLGLLELLDLKVLLAGQLSQ